MKNIGLNLDAYERDKPMTDADLAQSAAIHLNTLISLLVEADTILNPREFDLWRGMAAGTQAQGAWQNHKGQAAETAILELIYQHLSAQGFDVSIHPITLQQGRLLVVASDPDLAIMRDNMLEIAVEVKGGIDPAGALERLGAAIKSLTHVRQHHPKATTILVMHAGTFTQRAQGDIEANPNIDYLFNLNELLDNAPTRAAFFDLLGI